MTDPVHLNLELVFLVQDTKTETFSIESRFHKSRDDVHRANERTQTRQSIYSKK